MKRFHVHLGVLDLAASIRFYSGLFGQAPTVEKGDYAKWMIDDPRINFAISQRGGDAARTALASIISACRSTAPTSSRACARSSPPPTRPRSPTSRTRAAATRRSDKHWVRDPQGIAWEGYHSLRAIEFFDGDAAPAPTADAKAAACCTPAAAPTASAAVPAPPHAAPATGAGKCCA